MGYVRRMRDWDGNMRSLFLDLDGVLADFDSGFVETFKVDHRNGMEKKEMWKCIFGHDEFFYNLKPMAGFSRLLAAAQYLYTTGKVQRVCVLTACPKTQFEHVADQKKRWIRSHISEDIMVIPTYQSETKPVYIQNAGDILVDDWSKNCEAWEAAGGAAVKYEDATQASADLLRLFIKEREVA